jgi:hypothetical protein
MNSITLSCVITVDRETDKYNGEIFVSDDASPSDKLALCLMAIQQLQKMVDRIGKEIRTAISVEA